VNDDALLARQAELQSEAATFVRELGLIEILGPRRTRGSARQRRDRADGLARC
jgi:hypothetical protein